MTLFTNSIAVLGMNDHLLIVVVLILLLFGGKKIPELLYGAGKGIGEFKRGLEEARVETSMTNTKTQTQQPLAAQNEQTVPTTIVTETKETNT